MKIENLKEAELVLVNAGGLCLCSSPQSNADERWTTQTFQGCKTVCCRLGRVDEWLFSWREISTSEIRAGRCTAEKKCCCCAIIDSLKKFFTSGLYNHSPG